MWHQKNKPLEALGKVRTIGIIEEQHSERGCLFMQWRQMDFPILVDSLNLLDVSVVPLTVLIDEAGIIKAIQPDDQTLAEFVDTPPAAIPLVPPPGSARHVFDVANHIMLFGAAEGVNEAIEMYEQQCRDVPGDSRAHFRLGVAYRRRFDSPTMRKPGDFARSIAQWERALSLNPNQYIWRRRIQQYGPRLDKPYPFYDWVSEAQQEIKARGEEPVQLLVELSGAEVAKPDRGGGAERTGDRGDVTQPDLQGQIDRDQKALCTIETVVVPDTDNARRAVRVHILLTPSTVAQAKWNDEAGPSVVWINPPAGWTVEQRLFAVEPPSAGGDSTRFIEFEVKRGESSRDGGGEANAGGEVIHAYALYNVCYGTDGICTYVRQDFEILLQAGD